MANNQPSAKKKSSVIPHREIVHSKYKGKKNFKGQLPPEYKRAAKSAALVINDNQLKLDDVLDPNKQTICAKETYKIAKLAITHFKEIEYLMKKVNIISHPSLDPWIARILVAELLWGSQFLKTSAKQVEAIKYYEEDLRDAFLEATSLHGYLHKLEIRLPVYVRINTLAISIDACLNAFHKEGWSLLPRAKNYEQHLKMISEMGPKDFAKDYHISELLVFPHSTVLYNHPGYLKGKFVLQDKGSCLSSFLLNPKPESVVLDLCAAPGKKTNHLANIMGNTGVIYAVDNHPKRFLTMKNFLELTGVECVEPVSSDYISIPKTVRNQDFKYILIDPTCTYSGLFYGTNKTLQKNRLIGKNGMLSIMLRYTLQTFTTAKRVIFTTCSVFPEEGEYVVDAAMEDIGDSYTLLNVKEMLWNEWDSMSPPNYKCSDKCLRIVPEYDQCQGYFIAVFERNFDVPVPPFEKKFRKGDKLYTADEMEKVQTINYAGKIVSKLVPKHKVDKYTRKKMNLLEKKLKKAKEKKMQNLKKWNPELMTWRNPKLSSQKNPTLNQQSNPSSYSQPHQNSHSQLHSNSHLHSQPHPSFHSQPHPNSHLHSQPRTSSQSQQNFNSPGNSRYNLPSNSIFNSSGTSSSYNSSGNAHYKAPVGSSTLSQSNQSSTSYKAPALVQYPNQSSMVKSKYTTSSLPNRNLMPSSSSFLPQQSQASRLQPNPMSTAYPNVYAKSHSNKSAMERLYESFQSQIHP